MIIVYIFAAPCINIGSYCCLSPVLLYRYPVTVTVPDKNGENNGSIFSLVAAHRNWFMCRRVFIFTENTNIRKCTHTNASDNTIYII